MAKTKYDLDINKQAIIKPVVILRQGDHDIDTMQVSLSVANEPMDLTGATVTFMGNTANGRQIIDDAHVKIIDAKGGVFEYVFPSEASSDIGEYKVAYFSIILGNGQSSTMDFRVQVLSGVDISAPVASEYITHYDTMVTALNSAYDSATHETNQKMASTVSSLATSAATVLDSALARVNTINSTANNASSAASKAVSMASSVASTVTSQASYINSVASSAASNVSSVAATVVDKLNNISVGGRNYILNSSGMNASTSSRPILSGGTTDDSNSSLTYYPDRIVMTNNPGSTSEFFYGLTRAWTNITQTPLIAGNTYTISVKARGTAPQIALRVGYQNMNPSQSVTYRALDTTKWTKATLTFTIPIATTNIFIRLNGGINNQLFGFSGNETVEFKEVMLEQSNITSDWTPAPEDAPSNDAQLVHKTGNETIAGDKTFTDTTEFSNLIRGGLESRTANFTDLATVAADMQKYAGIWWFYQGTLLNSPIPNYVIIEVFKGSSKSNGYIRVTGINTRTSYYTIVNPNIISWQKIADDATVVHKTDNETVAGDKMFTGVINIPNQKQYRASFTIGANTINLTRIGSIVYVNARIREKINASASYGVIPTGFTPANNAVVSFIVNNTQGSCLFQTNHSVWFPADAPFDSNMSGSYLTSDALPS